MLRGHVSKRGLWSECCMWGMTLHATSTSLTVWEVSRGREDDMRISSRAEGRSRVRLGK